MTGDASKGREVRGLLFFAWASGIMTKEYASTGNFTGITYGHFAPSSPTLEIESDENAAVVSIAAGRARREEPG